MSKVVLLVLAGAGLKSVQADGGLPFRAGWPRLRAETERRRSDGRSQNFERSPTARQFKPHLVLLDIIMPRLPGGNVAAAFEADPELKDIPIMFFTAAVRRHQVEDHDGVICGHPCLAKPASVQEVVQSIEARLGSGAGV
jgi:CheY-like chemotaxis protein